MKRFIFFLLIAASVMIAQPQREGDDNAPPLGHGKRHLIEKLNFTSVQQKQFDKLQTEMQKTQIDLKSKIQTLRLDIQEFMRDDTPNKSKIELTFTEISKLQNEIKLSHLGFWFDVNKFLTPDQQKTWKERHIMMGVGSKGARGQHGDGMRPMGKRGRGMKYRECDPVCPGK